jgi:hypothetical protein
MAGALVLLAAFIAPVSTASEAQPEITDVKGDSASGKDSRDLTSAFFHTETNDTFKISMNLSSLEQYTNPNDIPTAPTTEYEVYFTIAASNYAVACRVPVHGPLGITIQYDIRAVTYGNNTTTENQLSTLSGCTYDVQDHLITWLVQKAQFGNLTAGTRLTKTWAAVYNKNFQEPSRRMEDRGPKDGYGKDYVIRGTTGGEIYKVELTADNLTQPCAPNDPAVFKISIYNNGTSQVTVDFYNTTVDKRGWTVVLSLDTNVTLPVNVTRLMTVTVTPPRDAKNGTYVSVGVQGRLRVSGQNLTTNSVYLTSTVNFIAPKAPAEPWWKPILNFFTKPTSMTYVVIALIVLGIAGLAGASVYSRLRRSREEEPAPPPQAPVPSK